MQASRVLARPRGRRQQGAASIEFALVLPMLLAVVFGIIQYGIYFYSAQTGSAVTGEALRRLSVGDCQVPGDLTTYVTSRLGAAATGPVSITRTYRSDTGAVETTPFVGGSVELRVTYDSLNMHFPFLPFLSDSSITRDLTARQEDAQAEAPCT